MERPTQMTLTLVYFWPRLLGPGCCTLCAKQQTGMPHLSGMDQVHTARPKRRLVGQQFAGLIARAGLLAKLILSATGWWAEPSQLAGEPLDTRRVSSVTHNVTTT